MQNNKKPGISIVVVSYKRLESLLVLLKSIQMQEVDQPLELCLVNNDPEIDLYEEGGAELQEILDQFDQLTLHEGAYNYDVSVRYWVAALARYNTILFLDDDVELLDPSFISIMYSVFHENLRKIDWLSCWTQKFTEGADYFETKSYSFLDQLEEPVEVDMVGPGISMFTKKLLHPDVITIPTQFSGVDNIWVPLKSTMILGTRKYCMPSYEMLRFSNIGYEEGIFSREGIKEMKKSLTQDLIAEGYVPLINRKDGE